ncbi:hypothetical protein B9057_07755 [Aestuarium zhoushanense]|nr:hypothetical protein B9057_07755 [Aestuarium zhoushanense]
MKFNVRFFWGAVALFFIIGGVFYSGLGRFGKAWVSAMVTEPQPMAFNYEVIPGSSGRRIYLLHGFRDNRDFWRREPYSTFTEVMLEAGHEIVLIDLPYAHADFLNDGGTQYCNRFREFMISLQAELGPPDETVIVGASWGGWHAMMIADLAARYVVFKPVTDPTSLSEFWWKQSSGDACSFREGRGLAIYSPMDPRVGDATSVLRAAGTVMQISEREDHGVTTTDLMLALEFLHD